MNDHRYGNPIHTVNYDSDTHFVDRFDRVRDDPTRFHYWTVCDRNFKTYASRLRDDRKTVSCVGCNDAVEKVPRFTRRFRPA